MLKNPKYLYGERDTTVPATINFGEFMLKNFWDFKDKTALINGSTNQIIKFEELAQEATNLAISLTSLGVRKGDVIAIISDNRSEYFSIFVGIACTGAVITPINHFYSEGEMEHALSISKPTYLFCTSTSYKTHEKVIKSTKNFKKIIIIDDEKISNTLNYKDLATVKESSLTGKNSSPSVAESSLTSVDSSFMSEESSLIKLTRNVKFEEMNAVGVNGQTDVLVILYSSGTTGFPKGVMLTHANVITMVKTKPLDFHEGIIMTIGPWFHAMGLMGTFSGLIRKNTFVFLPKFDLETMLRTVERYKVQLLVVVPAVLVAIIKSTIKFDFSSVTHIIVGAAPIHNDTIMDFRKKFPNILGIIQGYGMTECCLAIAKNRFSFKPKSTQTVGKVLNNAIIKILDLETRKPVGPHQTGEICVKGEILMKGYVGRDTKEDLDPEGFFRTGDVGYYDEEGYLYIVDRVKELIKFKGNQVAPAELEAILLQHEAVREVGVVGLLDEDAGELPMAFVSLQQGKTATEKEIQDFVAKLVSNPKRLRGGVRFLEEIPKNQTGKIVRQTLRKMANNQ